MTAPARGASELGAFAYWPENLFWSFQFIRLVGEASVGGADFTECHQVARNLPVGDADAWYDGFRTLARALDDRAATADAAGHVVSARDTWLRSSNYHRAAGFFLSPLDDRHAGAVLDRRRAFQAAAARMEPAIQPVEIPYEATTLPGYIFPAAPGARRPTPGAVIFGGADAVAEEMYFFLGRALADRGITVLAFDGPGQGEALRRGIVGRHDWEVPVAAAVDLLAARDEVDGDRIGLVGQSLGGYYASRAAAFEPRLKACVVWGQNYDVHSWLVDRLSRDDDPAVPHFVEQLGVILGVEGAEAVLARLEPFSLDGVAERIDCPTLILHGANDLLCDLDHAQRTLREIPHPVKELILYPEDTPGSTHCQVDALPLVQHDICNWLERQIAA